MFLCALFQRLEQRKSASDGHRPRHVAGQVRSGQRIEPNTESLQPSDRWYDVARERAHELGVGETHCFDYRWPTPGIARGRLNQGWIEVSAGVLNQMLLE